MKWPRTPTTPGAVARLANTGTPVEAVIDAWTNPGTNPGWNEMTRRCVRDAMPVLAAKSPVEAWDEADLTTRRAVLQDLGKVYLHPQQRGQKGLADGSVQIAWY